MEHLAEVMVVTAVCLAVGFVTLRGAGAAAQVMTQMFSSPANLGWPSGVQEDDDLHWSWSALPAGTGLHQPVAPPDDPPARPEIVELPDGTGPPPSPVGRH